MQSMSKKEETHTPPKKKENDELNCTFYCKPKATLRRKPFSMEWVNWMHIFFFGGGSNFIFYTCDQIFSDNQKTGQKLGSCDKTVYIRYPDMWSKSFLLITKETALVCNILKHQWAIWYHSLQIIYICNDH